MFCTKCGKEIKEGMKHCPFCGEIVQKGNTAKAAVSSDAKKLKKIKIILIIIALLLIGGLYNAITENKGGNSVLIGEWHWTHIDVTGRGQVNAVSPERNKKYYVKFFKNGTFEQYLNEGGKLKGTWSDDPEVAKTADAGGYIWAGRIELTGTDGSVQSGIAIIRPPVFNEESCSLILMYNDLTYIFSK